MYFAQKHPKVVKNGWEKNPFWARKLFGSFDKPPSHRFKGRGFLKLYTLSGLGKPRLDADDLFEKSCNFIRYVQKRDMKRFRSQFLKFEKEWSFVL